MQRFLSRTGLLVALSVGLSVGCDGEKGGPVVGEVTYGTTKAIEGEKWIIQLSGGTEKTYNIPVEANGKFNAPKVAAGGYKIMVTHYLPTPEPGKGMSGSTAPTQYNYPELWSVPGGPYSLDLSKLKAKR